MINLEGLKFAKKVKLTNKEKFKKDFVTATGCCYNFFNYLKVILNEKNEIKEIIITASPTKEDDSTLIFREIQKDETVVKASEYYNQWHINKKSSLGKIIAGVTEIIEANKPQDNDYED